MTGVALHAVGPLEIDRIDAPARSERVGRLRIWRGAAGDAARTALALTRQGGCLPVGRAGLGPSADPAAWVSARQDALAARLRAVAGQAEFVLVARWRGTEAPTPKRTSEGTPKRAPERTPEGGPKRTPEGGPLAAPASGRAYLRQAAVESAESRAHEEAVDRALDLALDAVEIALAEEDAVAIAARLRAAVAPTVRDLRVLAPLNAGPSLATALSIAAKTLDGSVALSGSGPWPAYSFADVAEAGEADR